MKIFELKKDWNRVWFYKKISWIKEYIKLIFGQNWKELDILHIDPLYEKKYRLDNWEMIKIEVETHNLIE
jgi:hypothetical protein